MRLIGAAQLRRAVFGVPEAQLKFETLGFRSQDVERVRHLERIPADFAVGYHAALETGSLAALTGLLESRVEPDMRGFAYEGAGMGLAIRDMLNPLGGELLPRFLAGEGAPHTYMVHVGAGWALARVPFRTRWLLGRLHPRYRWLAIEGYGFHEVYFHACRTLEQKRRPPRVLEDELPVFYHGVGRGLWFSHVADAARIAAEIEGFPVDLRAELWAGVGLAATYAGGMPAEELRRLIDAVGPHQPRFAQGVLFAAAARRRAKTDAAHSEDLARQVWGDRLDEIIEIATADGEQHLEDCSVDAYKRWCASISERFRCHA